MRRLLFAAAIALGATGSALAADLPAPPPAPTPYAPFIVPKYNWAGVYIGINGGYGIGESEWSPSGAPGTGNFNLDGGLVGATIGANFQSNPFPYVFGIEGDIDWTDITGSATNTPLVLPATCGTSCTFQTSNEWLATIRGRAGYAFDRVLLYVTAGGAAGDVKATLTSPPAGSGSNDNVEFGWAAGAGVEFAMAPNLTAKVEYLFVDLASGSFACTTALCGANVSVPASFDVSLIRAGLNFKFAAF